MLETLSRGFKSAREKLTGKTTLDASNIQDALADADDLPRRRFVPRRVGFNGTSMFHPAGFAG